MQLGRGTACRAPTSEHGQIRPLIFAEWRRVRLRTKNFSFKGHIENRRQAASLNFSWLPFPRARTGACPYTRLRAGLGFR